MTDVGMWAKKANWVLLGLVMLVAGAMKLFVMGSDAVATMLAGFGFPAATAFAWLLIVAEIGSGLLILARYKLEHVTWVPAVILVVAAFTAWRWDWGNMLIHFALASNYVVLGQSK